MYVVGAVAAEWRSRFCIESHVPRIKQTHFMFYSFSMKTKFKNANRDTATSRNMHRPRESEREREIERGSCSLINGAEQPPKLAH